MQYIDNKIIRNIIILSFFIVVSIFCSPVYSSDFTGSISSELYIWSDSSQSHVRPYQSLTANAYLWRGQKQQKLTFNTYLRWKSDLQNKLPNDPQLFVYEALLKLSNLPSRSRIYLGRQYVYSSAGSALIDGARIKYSLDKVQIDFFGGSRVNSLDPEKIQSLEDYLTMGSRISMLPLSNTKIGLNWMYRKTAGDISFNRLAADINYKYKNWKFYNRAGLNYEQMKLAEILSRLRYSYKEWYLSGEFHYREPSVSQNSVFSIIEFKKYKNLRFEIHRKLSDKIRLLTQLRVGLFSDDNSISTGIGIQTYRYSIIWHHQSGYGGERDGLTGTLNLPLDKNWYCYGSANLSKYKIQELQNDRSEAYSAIAGVMKKFEKNIRVKLELQLIRNAVMDNDSRFRIKLTKGFALDW